MSASEQRKQQRKLYEETRKLSLLKYATAIGDTLSSRIDLLSKLIGDAHYPSEGAYKERLLINTISDFLPTRFKAGTGFVLFAEPGTDPRFPLRQDSHKVSRQLDIIVYDTLDSPVVFSDGDFVVVRPESVRAIIEVKGFVDNTDIDSAVELFVDFGRKWGPYAKRYNTYLGRKVNGGAVEDNRIYHPSLIFMGWDVYVASSGSKPVNGEAMRDRIVKRYKALVDIDDYDGKQFPFITLACLYRNALISSMTKTENGITKLGYIASPGSITDENSGQTTPHDFTIAVLLSEIERSLDTSYNPLYGYAQEADDKSKLKVWLSGKEANMIFATFP